MERDRNECARTASEDVTPIRTESLTLADVPSPHASLEILEQFCLTIDGYQGERLTIDELLCEAERVERAGLEHATLEELRSAAFIRQRELRWTTYGDQLADAPIVRSIRALVREIRRRVEEHAQNGS